MDGTDRIDNTTHNVLMHDENCKWISPNFQIYLIRFF